MRFCSHLAFTIENTTLCKYRKASSLVLEHPLQPFMLTADLLGGSGGLWEVRERIIEVIGAKGRSVCGRLDSPITAGNA